MRARLTIKYVLHTLFFIIGSKNRFVTKIEITELKMKLLSILALCAALCIAVTHASSQVQEEEDNTDTQAVMQKIVKMLMDEAEAEDNADELAAMELSDEEEKKAKAQIAPIIPILAKAGISYGLRKIRLRKKW